jgi:hypothetical protein
MVVVLVASVVRALLDCLLNAVPGILSNFLRLVHQTISRLAHELGLALGLGKSKSNGGACSYDSRDWFLTSSTRETVRAPQAFAWNPSLPGAKAEDTFLLTADGPEILTRSPDWPEILFDIRGRTVQLAVLELPAGG